MANQFGNPSSTINPVTHHEVVENIHMSRWHWEAKLLRFEKMKAQPRAAEAWPWVGLLFATVPSLVSNTFELGFMFLDKDSWRLMFGVLALFSVLNLLRIFGGATTGWLHERNVCGWLSPRPPDWVPTNVAAFVSDVVDEIADSARRAAAESGNALSGTLGESPAGHRVGTEQSAQRVAE